MTYYLNERLRDLANCRHDDLSIGYEAAWRFAACKVAEAIGKAMK